MECNFLYPDLYALYLKMLSLRGTQPHPDWESRKVRIEELYMTLGYPLEGPNGTMEILAREGFTATLQQYEYRLRKWGFSKRKQARSTYGIQQRETTRPQSLPYHDASAMHRDRSVSRDCEDTSQTEGRRHMFEFASHRGTSPVETNGEDTIMADTGIDDIMQIQTNDNSNDAQQNTIGNSYYDLPPHDTNGRALNIHRSSSNSPFAASFDPDPSFSVNMFWRGVWLPLSPTTRLIALAVKYIYGRSLTTPALSALTKTNNSDLLFQFSNAVIESVPTSRGLTTFPITEYLSSLEVFAGEDWSQFGKPSAEVACEARFDGRLIAAVTNGFAGLQNIPAAGVLKFLNRHHATQQVVVNVLNTQSGPLAKAFAENAFVAYLEADNVDAVQYFLGRGLADANEAVCHYHGERYTPFEYAAMKQSFDVLRLLINRGVDANKSFPRADHSNALHLLIKKVEDRRSILDDNFLRLVDDLKAKTTISTRSIEMALEWFTDPQLAISLIENVASQTPRILISHKGLLRGIVKNLEERVVTNIFKRIIDKCGELGRVRYLYQFSLHVDDALKEAMGRGYDELVGILFPYTSSPGKVLQTAMEAGNQIIVELIRQKNPSLARDLGLDRDTEERDVLSPHGHRLGQALTDALKAGNLESATRILDLDPDFTFYETSTYGLKDDQTFDVAAALSAALAHNFDDIAWKLLALGLTTRGPAFLNLRPAPLLYVALQRKKPEFVKAILEFGVDRDIFGGNRNDQWKVLETALNYGDDAIFDDIWNVRPSTIYPEDSLLKLALEKGREDLFLDFVKSSPRRPDTWKNFALEVAVECENESVLDKLILLGARADNEIALDKALENHPSMVRPLLDRFWKAYPQGCAGYGQGLVLKALNNYSTSPESLDVVFALGLVIPNIISKGDFWQSDLLYMAIDTHDCYVVKRFIDAGSNVNNFNDDGYAKKTPLLDAIKTRIPEMVQLLIDHGARVNEPGRFGIRRTPLQKAAELNSIPILRLLLEKGADVNAAPALFDGATALQFAAIHGNCEMATILIERGATQSIPPPIGGRGRWPLEGAAENGRFDMIDLLWNDHISHIGSPPDVGICQNAMRLAERHGYLGCKEMIKELMARSFRRNDDGFLTGS
ncbi:hypothetical protein F4818DRAFT_423780 [Hypoxylon cercidicola]|nr:hypothetical protein F4818DRAFT_423780 [Hypoxylon cercidicola]